MNFFAFIMALLVLGLSCQPCADGDYTLSAGKAKAELVKVPSQQDESDHTDNCTPFCHCSCCAGFSLNHTLATLSDPYISDNRLLISFLPSNLTEISLPIWQPPQL